MSDPVADAIVAIVDAAAPDEMHWTVVLDRALREGAVPPSPEARTVVLRVLADAAREGRIVKTGTGTYRAGVGRAGGDG